MIKRLSSPTGQIESHKREGDSLEQVEREAILVHSGENGEAITFMSADGEISFDKARIKTIVDSQNALIQSWADGYGGLDKMPIGAFPPILDMHNDSDSMNRVIGRLNCLLTFEERDVPKVGKKVACVVAKKITFLGEDAVKKVIDGRIYHLSVGIDEESNTLGELSAVIEPAAPGAMILKKGKLKKGNTMSKKHLEASKKKVSKLSEMKKDLTTLQGQLKGATDLVKLTKKKGEVSGRLTKLMKGGKLTPAEFKKLDLTKLSAMPEEALNMTLDVFEAREAQVLPGQLGTTSGEDVSSIAKNLSKKNFSRLKLECKKDMARLSGKKLSAEEEKELSEGFADEGTKKLEDGEPKDEKKLEGEKEDHKPIFDKHAELGKHLEAGDIEKAKEAHAELSKHLEMIKPEDGEKHLELGDVKSEDYKNVVDSLQKQIDELNTQMGRMGGMLDELINVEQEEGEAFEKEAQEHEELNNPENIEGKKPEGMEGQPKA